MTTKLKLYNIIIPIPGKTNPFFGAQWANNPKIALKHCLRKAFRVRGITAFFIDGKEFDAASTTYAYILKTNRIGEFVKDAEPLI
jgi:hypothetical protein